MLLILATAGLAAEPPTYPSDCSPGAYYIARGDFDRALKSLEGVKGGTGSAAEENLKGLALLLAGRLEEAVTIFDKLVRENGTFMEARFNRGVALLRGAKYPSAAADFEGVFAVEDQPLRPSAAFHRALCAEAMSESAAAESWARRATQLDPESADSWLLLGWILEEERRFEDAGKAYREALARRPDSLIATLRFAISAHRAGYRETALTYFRRVVQMAPSSPEGLEAEKFLLLLE